MFHPDLPLYPFYCPGCEEGRSAASVFAARSRLPVRLQQQLQELKSTQRMWEKAQARFLNRDIDFELQEMFGVPPRLDDPIRYLGFGKLVGYCPDLRKWLLDLRNDENSPNYIYTPASAQHQSWLRRSQVPAMLLPLGTFPGQILGFWVVTTKLSFCIRSRRFPGHNLRFYANSAPNTELKQFVYLEDMLDVAIEQLLLCERPYSSCWSVPVLATALRQRTSQTNPHPTDPTIVPLEGSAFGHTRDSYRRNSRR
jgi:hypothetical protein